MEDDKKKIIISKTRWVVGRGLRLGGKVIMTGIVVSSAPLVLPPLIAISVLGFLVSVPAGLAVASYACTVKLMSKLLPMPPAASPPLLLEYHEVDEELYGRDYEGEFAMAMAGEEGVEERLELGYEGRDGVAEESKFVGEYEDEDDINGDEHLEEEGCVVDVVECLEGEGEKDEDSNIDENLEDVNVDENLEKGYEQDGEYSEGECEDGKGVLKDEKDVYIDENLEKGYNEDVSEYLEAEQGDMKENIIDGSFKYVEEIGEYLEGEDKDSKDENLEKGYEEASEYFEREQVDVEDVSKDFEDEHEKDDGNLEKGYEEASEYFDREQADVEGVTAYANLKEDYVEGDSNDFEDKHEKDSDGNLEKGYEEASEYFEREQVDVEDVTAYANLKEDYVEGDRKDFEDEHEKDKDGNFEKGYEEDVGEYLKGIAIENIKVEGYVEEVVECLEGEDNDNKDNNVEEGFKVDVGEYMEGEQGNGKEITIDENINEEDYVEEVVEYLEVEDGDNKYENLEKGYKVDVGEYLEGEKGDRKVITVDENLKEEGYAYNIGKYLEGEQGGGIESTIDGNLKEEAIDQYLEGEHEGPVTEMNIEVEQELHCEFGEMNIDVGNNEVEETFEGRSELLEKANGFKVEYAKVERTVIELKTAAEAEASPTEKEIAPETEKQSVREDLMKQHVHEDQPLLINNEHVQENVSSSLDAQPKDVFGVEEEKPETAPESSIDEMRSTNQSAIHEEGKAVEQDSSGLHPSERNEIKTKEGAEEPSSEEVMLSEEKIWEQVCSIRAILGYTAAAQSSTVDEIKALFLFIGVEPPPSFEDPSDLTDVNEKLRILMAIVGTK